MTRDFFSINFSRLRELKRETEETEEVYRRVREKLQSLNIRFSNLERLMTAEVYATGDKNLERQLNEILKNKGSEDKELARHEDFNKTEFLIRILFNENLSGKGLTPKELFDLVQQTEKKDQITLMYTNSILGKLKKKGMIEQRDRRYFLTEVGRGHWGEVLS